MNTQGRHASATTGSAANREGRVVDREPAVLCQPRHIIPVAMHGRRTGIIRLPACEIQNLQKLRGRSVPLAADRMRADEAQRPILVTSQLGDGATESPVSRVMWPAVA
jgi:hypothetical protein